MIVGLGAACAVAKGDLHAEGARQSGLRKRLWDRLREGIDGIVWTAGEATLLPNTLHVRVPGMDGRAILAAAPEVAASTGSACHTDEDKPSGALGAMGLAGADARGALRLTLGRRTTEADVDRAADGLLRAVAEVRA